MRWLLILLLSFSFSCKSLTEMEKLQKTLTGQWLVIAPDHILKNDRQRVIYSKIQDSIVGLRGLKMILLSEDGSFQQMDSFNIKGKWGLSPEKVLRIENGGAGFENYSATFTDYKDRTLKLTSFVQADGESIKLIWELKKVSGDATDLFERENNEWRKKPVQAETEAQMKKRLADMLNYYSEYYTLVSKEASYFIPSRVPLPFKFYQHSMGIRMLDPESPFLKLFFNQDQAEEAYGYLAETLTLLKDDFPSIADSYVKEYAAFMKQMAEAMVKAK